MVGEIQKVNTIENLHEAKELIRIIGCQIDNFLEGCEDKKSKSFQEHETYLQYAVILGNDVSQLTSVVLKIRYEAEDSLTKHLQHKLRNL